MEAGTRFLMGSALRALHAANARTPIATDGPLSIPAFAFGWPASELPTQHIAAYATVAGETVTLRGRVLPIGGLKEKLLAALRGGITTVFIPAENEKDLVEIPASVKDALEIIPVEHVDEVLAQALSQPLKAIEWTDADEQATEPVVHPPVGGDGAPVRH